MFLWSGEVPRAGEGQAGGCAAAAGEAREPGLMARGAVEGLRCRENPSSLLTGTGKSCLENWTRRRSWESLSAGARGERAVKPPGSRGEFPCQPSGLGLLTLQPDERVTVAREILSPGVNAAESYLKGWRGESCQRRDRHLLETGRLCSGQESWCKGTGFSCSLTLQDPTALSLSSKALAVGAQECWKSLSSTL